MQIKKGVTYYEIRKDLLKTRVKTIKKNTVCPKLDVSGVRMVNRYILL